MTLTGPSLDRHPHGRVIAAIAEAALAAVDPRTCVLRSTHRITTPRGQAALFGEFMFELAEDPARADPNQIASLRVFGAGKASAAMAAALVERFGDRIVDGLVIVKHRPSVALAPAEPSDPAGVIGRIGSIAIMLGDHPIPATQTKAAVAELRRRASLVTGSDLVLCPISGGASALLSEPTLGPEPWSELHRWLLANDVSIQAINRIRRRFDALKAGGLARLFEPATVVGLLLSDVVGDELALIGSGPTVYLDERERSDYASVVVELAHAGLPEPLRMLLERPPAEPEPAGQRVHNVLLGRNGDAREAACRRARAEGLDGLIVLPALGGLAVEQGRRLATMLAELPGELPITLPCCIVMGGETTVALGADELIRVGLGGRNQELALAAIERLASVPGAALLSLATDGEDGPTDGAGALVTEHTLDRARARGLDLDRALREHASHDVLEQLGAVVRTGPTGTNVGDLALLFRF